MLGGTKPKEEVEIGALDGSSQSSGG
jgi:hypothetical protein